MLADASSNISSGAVGRGLDARVVQAAAGATLRRSGFVCWSAVSQTQRLDLHAGLTSHCSVHEALGGAAVYHACWRLWPGAKPS